MFPVAIRQVDPVKDVEEVLGIAKAWPTHFVAEGIRQIDRDLLQHQALIATVLVPKVSKSKHEVVAGFIIWRAEGKQAELLWMAVRPELGHRGIGRQLVERFLAEVKAYERVVLRTATTDSEIPGTDFHGKSYSATHRFFESVGFQDEEVIRSYWGPTNHCLLMRMRSRTAG